MVRDVAMGFPDSSVGKESACNAGYLGSIPGLGRSPGEGKGYPFQYSGLENSMACIVHGVTKELDTTEQHSFSLLPHASDTNKSESRPLPWRMRLPEPALQE